MVSRHFNHLGTNWPNSICLEFVDIDGIYFCNQWFYNSVVKNKDHRQGKDWGTALEFTLLQIPFDRQCGPLIRWSTVQ